MHPCRRQRIEFQPHQRVGLLIARLGEQDLELPVLHGMDITLRPSGIAVAAPADRPAMAGNQKSLLLRLKRAGWSVPARTMG
jgi:hypothetical protein